MEIEAIVEKSGPGQWAVLGESMSWSEARKMVKSLRTQRGNLDGIAVRHLRAGIMVETAAALWLRRR
jgi:hypothetical protein